MYGLVAVYLSQACKRDPTSLFFYPNTAYQAKYSRRIKEEAVEFVQDSNYTDLFIALSASLPTVLCVGIPSIMRNNSQYLHYTIGSLFNGLSDTERQEIIFLVLIANTVPRVHYAYEQPWLKQVVDIVFKYNETLPGYDDLVALEGSKDYWTKGRLDYTFILERCSDTGAPYILIAEDDVLAGDRWYLQTKQALQS
ncbi:uncharacterized protein PV07_02605 [Cladophialophora immunda]|uniref:Uncharacterized protein n=1 Tax=Cladophialophora immunda TaxID=569365 RepID=A0A0D2CIE5_9EURO|nr:uncharacterized protein PV07_02605 [Cladophialophora immunda]KIW30913.1 hypothetical protein PV07_02605 [Cladophialophora immunda]